MIKIPEPWGNPGSNEDGSAALENCVAAGGWIEFTAKYELFGVDSRFVDEHHRNIFANGIDATARWAFQSVLVGSQFDRSFVQRANQNIEKLL
jgi:hypothetical protein